MRRHVATLAIAALVLAALSLAASAEPIAFKINKNYSQASLRSDAPLETFVGTSALEGIDGSLTVDPNKPQEPKRSSRST